jgi:hypothetical protein
MNKSSIFLALFFLLITMACNDKEKSFEGKACFDYSPKTNIELGETIVFTNCSTSGEYYFWNFGDNTTSTEKNPTHEYTEKGTFTVTLAIQNTPFRDLNYDMKIDELDRERFASDTTTATITLQ